MVKSNPSAGGLKGQYLLICKVIRYCLLALLSHKVIVYIFNTFIYIRVKPKTHRTRASRERHASRVIRVSNHFSSFHIA